MERILEMAKRIGAEKPYAKAGIIGAKAEKRHATELERANHAAAKEQARFAGNKAPKLGGGSGPSNIELALIHEFGAPSVGIPARPFIRGSFDKNAEKYVGMCWRLIRKVYEGFPERQALGLLGLTMATDMKLGVTQGEGIQPGLAPATLRRKLSKTRRGKKPKDGPRALVDTGQMVGAISWEVVAGEAVVKHGEGHE